MRSLKSEADVTSLLQNRPDETHTYRVPEEVYRRIPLDAVGLRYMNDEERQELAHYLDVSVDRLAGPFRVVEAACPSCGRRSTFLDFVKTAVEDGRHTVDELRDIVTGNAGTWITIRGKDGGRPVRCANCDQALRMDGGYSEYSSSSYAYA